MDWTAFITGIAAGGCCVMIGYIIGAEHARCANNLKRLGIAAKTLPMDSDSDSDSDEDHAPPDDEYGPYHGDQWKRRHK